MAGQSIPAPALSELMEALLELEAGKPSVATRSLAAAALHSGLPRKRVPDYLVEVVRLAKDVRGWLGAAPPDFSLVIAMLSPDQALAYLYEVEEAVSGPVGYLIERQWGALDPEDRAQLIIDTLQAARHLRAQWQDQVGAVRWDLSAVYA